MLRMMTRVVVLALGVCLSAGAGAADDQIRQLRLQVRQSMQAAREAQQEAAKAQAEAGVVQGEREVLSLQLQSAESERGRLNASLGEARAERGRLAERVAALEEALAQERAAHESTRDRLGVQTRGRLDAEAGLAGEREKLASCRQHNGQLVNAVDELMHAYEEKGTLSVLAEREPFTGIGRVRLENMLETYRDAVEDAREPVSEGSPPG